MAGEPQPDDCWAPGSVRIPPAGAGPLTGISLAVKDMIAVQGHVSSFGHSRWRETHAASTQTAPVLSGLLAAGASVAGLAKLDQLAWSIVGNAGEGTAPLNPAYPDRFTGGSSCGPSAAVASGLADVGIGTDTGGSIRVPAAACGLYGLRPTHSLIDTEGVLPLAPSFDAVGFLAGSLAALGQVFTVAAGNVAEVAAAVAEPPRPRQVVVPTDCLAAVSLPTSEAARVLAATIAEAVGCALRERELGAVFNNDVADLFARIQAREAWKMHGQWLADNIGVLAPDVAGRVRRAKELSAAPHDERDDDQRARRAYVAALDEQLPADAIAVLPVMPDLPPLRTASLADLQSFRGGAFRYTTPASLSGRPQLVIPVRHMDSGRLLGVGVLGPRGGDAGLIAIAARICSAEGPLAV